MLSYYSIICVWLLMVSIEIIQSENDLDDSETEDQSLDQGALQRDKRLILARPAYVPPTHDCELECVTSNLPKNFVPSKSTNYIKTIAAECKRECKSRLVLTKPVQSQFNYRNPIQGDSSSTAFSCQIECFARQPSSLTLNEKRKICQEKCNSG